MSTRLLLIAAVLLYCPCAFSQEAEAAKAKARASIRGRAVYSSTGKPLERETLTIRQLPPGTDAWVVQSDGDGYFAFEEMEPGPYILCVRRLGDDGKFVNLSAGQVLQDVEFRVDLPGAIHGIVVDDEGTPLANARVSAVGGVFRPSTWSVSTDSAGNFRFASLVPGSYVLLTTFAKKRPGATSPLPLPGPKEAEIQFLPTYYPSSTEVGGAATLQVAPGQNLEGITITVRRGRVHRISGKIVTSSFERLSGNVGLMLRRRGAEAGESVETDLRADGTFDFEYIPPGSYDLVAWRRKPAPTVTLGRAQLDLHLADVSGIVLGIEEPVRLHGKLRMEGQDKPAWSGVRVQLTGLLRGSPVDAEGAFVLEDVPREKQAILLTGIPEKAYVKSIRVGRLEAVESGLDLTGMSTVPPLDILISPNGASITGTVNQEDDKPSPGAWVCLVPDSDQPGLISRVKTATADGAGGFKFSGIAPGEYRLFAVERLRFTPYGNLESEFFRRYQGRAAKLELREGQQERLTIKAQALQEMALGSR